ncbi:MAG: hypothetical protein O2810_06240 [Bacteroidetes bacterium]|nr:hypothetical protein [Bacteroidota bacterium]MDA1085108.1 hypothetical protein [Bacteroidota bacterium]
MDEECQAEKCSKIKEFAPLEIIGNCLIALEENRFPKSEIVG